MEDVYQEKEQGWKDKEVYMSRRMRMQERRMGTLEKQLQLLQSAEGMESPRKAMKEKEG
jgi:hypothetical protein